MKNFLFQRTMDFYQALLSKSPSAYVFFFFTWKVQELEKNLRVRIAESWPWTDLPPLFGKKTVWAWNVNSNAILATLRCNTKLLMLTFECYVYKWLFSTFGWENSQVISVWVWINVWCLNCLAVVSVCGATASKSASWFPLFIQFVVCWHSVEFSKPVYFLCGDRKCFRLLFKLFRFELIWIRCAPL